MNYDEQLKKKFGLDVSAKTYSQWQKVSLAFMRILVSIDNNLDTIAHELAQRRTRDE